MMNNTGPQKDPSEIPDNTSVQDKVSHLLILFVAYYLKSFSSTEVTVIYAIPFYFPNLPLVRDTIEGFLEVCIHLQVIVQSFCPIIQHC